jgi:5-methylcytosine-specific restriction endonuclease McrA
MPKNRVRTNEDFLAKVKLLTNGEYEFLDPYQGSRTRIRVKHKPCDYIFYTTPNHFLSNGGYKRCRKCGREKAAQRLRKSAQQFKEEFDRVADGEYELLSAYKNAKTCITIKHQECGAIFQAIPYNFFINRRCPNCAKKERPLSLSKGHANFLKELIQLYGNEYAILEEYINNRTKLKARHNPCGFVFEVRPERILSGTSLCPVCVKGMARTTESVRKQIDILTNGEYQLVGEYRRNKAKIQVKHKKCGYVWKVYPDNFLGKGSRCPWCAALKITGEGHPRWNPNLTDEERMKERTKDPEYREWVLAVFRRDGFTCQLCGSTESNALVAHHLNGYDKFVEQRTMVENGITLCERCHKEFHGEYGYGGNTRKQFGEFVQKKAS